VKSTAPPRPGESRLGRLRSWLFTIPLASLATAFLITVAIATSVAAPAGRWQRFLYRLWGRAVLGIAGAKVRVCGAENLSAGRNYVFGANHLSLLDIPLMFMGLPVDFKFLAKRELLKAPFVGWYLRRAGHLTVDRASLRSSVESTNEAARLIGERRLSVLIFAEGRRSATGRLQPFKEGAAWVAIQSKTPLAPVAIAGTDEMLPAKSSYFMPGEVELRIGRPIPVEGLTLKDRAALTAELRERVEELLNLPARA
jgi:1-acyl-sn-glycerol-3-phosphate acyltransferase